ncbi:MAG: homocysteine S-methyltransferase family protein [Chloroflexi bacterium]|nr:homocysteine S-methyltransferase family protein [Chloroflexota bacterium]
MLESLPSRLQNGRPLVCHGALGTVLQSDDEEFNRAPELLNLSRAESVLALQREYVAAGAELLGSFTFGANAVKLARAGLADRIRELNLAAVRLARQAADRTAYVAGTIGPTGELLAPYGELSAGRATAAYAAQAAALAEGGVDLFWIKTMSDLAEVKAAVAGIRSVSDLPIFCSLSFGMGGRTMMGVGPSQAARDLAELALAGIGANCGLGPGEMLPMLAEMLEACPEAVLVAQPNAGLPELAGGEAVYDVGPEEFADFARRCSALGVRAIGGCCGSTPAHIAAVAAALASL